MGLIKDDYPNVIKYLVNKKDANIYTHGTIGKVLCECPLCKHRKYIEIHNLCINGFHCDICSDGISFPNKWIRKVLQYNNIDFVAEYHPTYFPKRWSCDIFIPSLNTIIEMDGDYGNHNINVDYYRDWLNLKYGGIKTIRFNLTDGTYRKDINHLINMTIKLLSDIIDIHNTDWMFIYEFCQNSIVKDICDLYKTNSYTTSDLANIFQLNICTIIKYLKIGNDVGFCTYDVESQKAKNGKSIEVYDDLDKSVKIFKNSLDLERQSLDIYGVQLKHTRELRRAFDNGRKSLYLKRFKIKSYNSCND